MLPQIQTPKWLGSEGCPGGGRWLWFISVIELPDRLFGRHGFWFGESREESHLPVQNSWNGGSLLLLERRRFATYIPVSLRRGTLQSPAAAYGADWDWAAPTTGGLGQRHPAVMGSGDPCPSSVGRSQRVTTPHCSCWTVHISRTWGAPPTDSVLEPELDTPQSTSKRWLAFTGVSFSWCFADILELAVRALARIMCANIHSQNGTAILAQALLFTQVRKFETHPPSPGMAAEPDLSQIPPSDIPDALQDGIAKLSTPLKQLLMGKSVVARQQGPRELGFEANRNGFTVASSGFAAMKLFQVVRAAKEMIQTHPSVLATPGPGPSRSLSLSEVLCERPQLEKEFTAKWGIPKPQYRDQGSDALLRRQYKFCSKGEIGGLSTPSTSSVPFRKKGRGHSRPAGRFQWMAGRRKKRKKNGQHQPLGVNWRDCTWCSETPCWCVWLPFPSFLNSTWRRKTLILSMIGSMDQRWGAVGLPLQSRLCSWQNATHGERSMSWCMVAWIWRKHSIRSRTTACSGWEKSMSESSHNKQMGNPRKARTRRAHGGPPSANLNGRRKVRAKETKGAKEKGRQSLNPQTGHQIGLSRIRRVFPSAVITSSRRPAKASVDVPTIVQLWTLMAGFAMQDPKSTSQKIAFTRLERIGRLPVALWRILEAQREKTPRCAGGTCSALTTVGGRDTSETGRSPDISRTVGPNVSHLALGTAANGAVTPRKTGVHAKRARPAESAASQCGKSAKNSNLTGRGPGQGFSIQNQMSSGSELSDACSWLRYVPNRLRQRVLPTVAQGAFNPEPILVLLYAGKDDPLSLDSCFHAHYPRLSPHVVAFDTRRSPQPLGHDLLDDQPYGKLCQAAIEGRVRLVCGGPNCRTWSILRWFPKPNAPSEQEDVDGDSLLILRQMFLTTLMKQNYSLPTASFLEHPRDPLECSSSPSASRCSSLWATKVFKAWYPTVGHTLVKFDQCRLGQLVEKATSISSDLDIQCWDGLRCNHSPHKLPEDMQSSDLSRYPPMMQGLAGAISQALSDIGHEPSKLTAD